MGGGSSGYSLSPIGSKEDSERIFKSAVDEVQKARIRNVFISFNINDEAQVDLMRAQAKNKNYDIEFRDYSVKEPFDAAWKTKCKERIAQTSATIVMIGPRTASREAVNWEINESLRQGKKVIGVRIQKDRSHPTPKPLRDYDCRIINCNLAKISKILDEK